MTRLARALGVRPGEGRIVALVGLLFAAVEAGRGLGEVGVDALVLNRLGAGALPALFVGLGLLSLAVALAYGTALGRARGARFFVGMLVVVAGVLVVERIAAATEADAVYPVLWVSVYAAGVVLTTALWTIAGSVFDARQAKRLFPLGTSAAIVGGFGGMVAAGPIAGLIGAQNLVVLDAVLILAAAVVAAAIGDRLRRGRSGERTPLLAALGAGYRYTAASPLMRLVAISYVLFAVLMFSVSFPFYRAMSDAFTTESDLALALGLFSAAVTGASFLVSTTLANRVYRRFGVTTAALALPVVYLAGFGVWLIRFTLPTGIGVRFAQQVVQRGLSNAAWSSFFNVIPAERRGQVLAFIDGVPGQVGTVLSGILLLAATAFAPGQVFWLGLAAAALCTVTVVAVRRRYADSIVRTLREGLAEQVLEGGPGLGALARDPRVIADLREALRSTRPGDRRMAAQLLGTIGDRDAVEALVRAVGDDDAGVRSAALAAVGALAAGGALGRVGSVPDSAEAEEAVRGALHDPDPAVRTAAVAAAATLDPVTVTDASDALLADPDPAVRAELAVALIRAGEEDRPHGILADLLDSSAAADRIAGLDAVRRLGGHAPSPRITASLVDPAPTVRAAAVRAVAVVSVGIDDPTSQLMSALDDGARVVRTAAAEVLRERGAPPDALLATLASGSERAQAAALDALDGRAADVAPALIGWAEGQVRRATVLRRHSLALARAAATAAAGAASSADFLRFLLERRGRGIEERLLAALSVLGAPEASGLIGRCLRSDVPETRAQAIEALEALGDPRLGRAVVELLEIDPSGGPTPLGEVLGGLADDPDPWVRALALRTLSEHLAAERRSILERAAADPDPLVGAVVRAEGEDGGSGLGETVATLGDVERMLFLRRVPLFAQLAPEDLQRLAMTAVERHYPGGEALVREGDLGDELVVIVEGSVRVVKGDGTSERLLRTYAAGDHIGELAVLRERPRAATVIAEEPGVRGLVIGGEGLKAILQERPEAAWAMLATLAERLTVQ